MTRHHRAPFTTMLKTTPKLDTQRVIESLITAAVTALAILMSMGDTIKELSATVKSVAAQVSAIDVARARTEAEAQANYAALVKWNEQQDAAIKALQQKGK